jgi:hypothetical protein
MKLRGNQDGYPRNHFEQDAHASQTSPFFYWQQGPEMVGSYKLGCDVAPAGTITMAR